MFAKINIVRTLLLIAALLAASLSCGACGDEANDNDICRQAVAKHSACMDEVDPFGVKLKLEGPCNNEVQFQGKIVAFRSWAEVYVPCQLPPLTCTCPGQAWITDP